MIIIRIQQKWLIGITKLWIFQIHFLKGSIRIISENVDSIQRKIRSKIVNRQKIQFLGDIQAFTGGIHVEIQASENMTPRKSVQTQLRNYCPLIQPYIHDNLLSKDGLQNSGRCMIES